MRFPLRRSRSTVPKLNITLSWVTLPRTTKVTSKDCSFQVFFTAWLGSFFYFGSILGKRSILIKQTILHYLVITLPMARYAQFKSFKWISNHKLGCWSKVIYLLPLKHLSQKGFGLSSFLSNHLPTVEEMEKLNKTSRRSEGRKQLKNKMFWWNSKNAKVSLLKNERFYSSILKKQDEKTCTVSQVFGRCIC